MIQLGWDHYVNGPNQEPHVETMFREVIKSSALTSVAIFFPSALYHSGGHQHLSPEQ